MDIAPLLEGFVLGASLIMAIGAQNAFVLRQGLKKQHVFLTAFTCMIADSFLVILGVEGMAEILEGFPRLTQYFIWAGAIFLIAYGLRSFYNVFHPHALIAKLQGSKKLSRWATILAVLGFTFLNPHAYIDTLLILGTVGAEHPAHEHLPFIMGVVLASIVWFFSLAYGASFLSPYFKNPRAWQVLDALTGCVMIGIVISLIV